LTPFTSALVLIPLVLSIPSQLVVFLSLLKQLPALTMQSIVLLFQLGKAFTILYERPHRFGLRLIRPAITR
jgi:hypothetical protein